MVDEGKGRSVTADVRQLMLQDTTWQQRLKQFVCLKNIIVTEGSVPELLGIVRAIVHKNARTLRILHMGSMGLLSFFPAFLSFFNGQSCFRICVNWNALISWMLIC